MMKTLETMEIESSKLIDALGGNKEVARLCDVSSQLVSMWRKKGISKGWIKYLEKAKPNVFKKLREQTKP